jgi:hypothetical protein
VNEDWARENVARFIEACVLLERRNNLVDIELSLRSIEIEKQSGRALDVNEEPKWRPLRWAALPQRHDEGDPRRSEVGRALGRRA